jgi:DNA-nicking Smr family endonuclease
MSSEDPGPDFHTAMAGVQPRQKSDRLPPDRVVPSARPRSTEADERAVLDELLHVDFELELIDSGETLAYRADGIQDGVWRKLRRGAFRIGAELDLHGLNRERAQAAVGAFLAECLERDLRCVRIIHGKGNRSPNSGPIIKTLLDGWLRRRRDVLAFCSARGHDGGTGAVYVLLRAVQRGHG